jgi:hypothetical protein
MKLDICTTDFQSVDCDPCAQLRRTRSPSYLLLALAACFSVANIASAAAPDIGPWIKKYCGDCHAGGANEGNVSLDGLKRFTDVSPDTWGAMHEQLQLGLMPPGKSTQPPPAERAAIVGWIADSMRNAGHHVRDNLVLPNLEKPVDSSGAVVDSGVPSLDGPVKNAVELIERLAASKRAEEMFVRYAFRFFLGRNETLRDAETLRQAHAAYVDSKGSMKTLVVSLLSSDSFLYRSTEP